jgi:hypothetical protein
MGKRETRLTGPVPEDVDLDVEPVIIELLPKKGKRGTVLIIIYGAITTYLVIVLVSMLTGWGSDIEDLHDHITIALLVGVLAVITGTMTYAGLMEHREVVSDKLAIDPDGLRLLRDDRVLAEMTLNGRVSVDALFEPDSDGTWFEGIVFMLRKGFWEFYFGTHKGMSVEDLLRIWPVLRAAAWKHRMLAGPGIIDPLKGGALRNPLEDRWLELGDPNRWMVHLGMASVVVVTGSMSIVLLMTGETPLAGVFGTICVGALIIERWASAARRRYLRAVKRMFELRAYEVLPVEERPEALKRDLMAEQWGLKLKRERRPMGWAFEKVFETGDGVLLTVSGPLKQERFMVVFILSLDEDGLKQEVESFAREKGWRED